MFNFFKKVPSNNSDKDDVVEFNFELVGCALAYEVAKADGAIDTNELDKIKAEIENKSNELGITIQKFPRVRKEFGSVKLRNPTHPSPRPGR